MCRRDLATHKEVQAVKEYDCMDEHDDDTCPHCQGRGCLTVETDGGGPAYHCPDCNDEREL